MSRLASFVCIVAMTACSWVKDDVDDCPYGFWLNLHYTYNILDVEAAPRYVTDAYIYVYDAGGNYVRRIFASHDDLAAGNYRVRVEGLPEGDYQFVVWSGLGSSRYAVAGDTQTLSDFRLSLAASADTVGTRLPPLFHGYLPAVHVDDSYAVHDVQLTKNTNQLTCLVVSVAEKTQVEADDFCLKVVADNGIMDAWNGLHGSAATVYEPFAQELVTLDDAEYGQLNGIKFDIMTLRMVNSRDCRLLLEKKSTGEDVVSLSLPEYIGMAGAYYTNLGREIPLQEYLDRQDFYTVVLYLSGDLDQLIQLQVNNWRVRAYNHVKL